MFISPNYPDKKLENASIDDLIDVFEDRITFWLLKPAENLLNLNNGFISAVALLLTYFEGFSIYQLGEKSEGKSKKFFRDAFVSVFKKTGDKEELLGRVADVLYEDARCGFFHDGMFRDKIIFDTRKAKTLLVTLPKVEGKLDEKGKIQSVVI